MYALVLIFGAIAAATIDNLPAQLRLAIVSAIEIALMTSAIPLWMTWRLSRWIYPTNRTKSATG